MDLMAEQSIARRVAAGLGTIALAIKSRRWKEAKTIRLTPLQAEVLTILRRQPHDTATVSQIGLALAVALPTASEVLRVLASRGLIRKQRCTRTDARVVLVRLTAKGSKKADAVANRRQVLATAVMVLDPAEQVSTLRTLITLIRTLEENGAVPNAQMCVTCRFFQPHVYAHHGQPHHCDLLDAPFGDDLLRIDCPVHQATEKGERDRTWTRFLNGSRVETPPTEAGTSRSEDLQQRSYTSELHSSSS